MMASRWKSVIQSAKNEEAARNPSSLLFPANYPNPSLSIPSSLSSSSSSSSSVTPNVSSLHPSTTLPMNTTNLRLSSSSTSSYNNTNGIASSDMSSFRTLLSTDTDNPHTKNPYQHNAKPYSNGSRPTVPSVAYSTASQSSHAKPESSFIASFADKWRKRGEKHTRGDHFLKMNPREKTASGQEIGPVGIPVREILHQIYHHKRDNTIRDCWIYLLYTIVFVAVVYQINNSADAYSTNAAVFDLFLDEEFISGVTFDNPSVPVTDDFATLNANNTSPVYYNFPQGTIVNQYKKTYFDIGSFEEIRDWLQGPFINAMYPTEYYNGDNFDSTQKNYLRYYLELIHGVRFWQIRINETCTPDNSVYRVLVDQSSDTCYFSPGETDDTTPFGPPEYPNKYNWSSNVASTDAVGLNGWGEASYGKSGYFVYLPNDGVKATQILDDLLKDRWLDERTRALIIDFNLLNKDRHLITVSRFTIEFLSTGLFLTSYRMYTFKIQLYETPIDKFRALGEIVILLGCGYYFWAILRQLRKTKPWRKYFAEPGNVFDLMLQACMLCCIIYWVDHIQNTNSKIEKLHVNCTSTTTTSPGAYGVPTCFDDLYGFAQKFNYAVTFAGFLGFLMSMKFFRYFSISRRMSTLWLTLARAAQALFAFCVGFCLMVAGFAFMGQMCFGSMVADFHTFESSFSTLLRYPLGDFDYDTLSRARPDVAAIFFVLYMALVFLVCMNMMVGIITVAFEEVNERLVMEEKWKHAGKTFEQTYIRRFIIRFRGLCRRVTSGYIGGDGIDELVLNSEQHYLRLMGKFIDRAEDFSRVDLLRYMEDVYKACPPGQNLYMGINELCSLARNTSHNVDAFCLNGHKKVTRTNNALSPTAKVSTHANHNPNLPWYSKLYACDCWKRHPASLLSSQSPTNMNGGSVSVTVNNPSFGSTVSDPSTSSPANSTGSVSTTNTFLFSKASMNDKRKSLTLGIPRPGVTPSQLNAELTAANEGALTPTDLIALHGDKCIAWQLVHAYYGFKDVTCLGTTERHQFWDGMKGSTGISTKSNVHGSWKISKLNRSNRVQERIISIEEDKDRYLLTSRDSRLRLKRRFPLSQIVQVEASLPNPRRAFLYIEASQPEHRDWDSYLAITQDTVYDILFRTQQYRDEFLDVVAKYRTEMQVNDEKLFVQVMGSTEAAIAAKKLKGEGISKTLLKSNSVANRAGSSRDFVGLSSSSRQASMRFSQGNQSLSDTDHNNTTEKKPLDIMSLIRAAKEKEKQEAQSTSQASSVGTGSTNPLSAYPTNRPESFDMNRSMNSSSRTTIYSDNEDENDDGNHPDEEDEENNNHNHNKHSIRSLRSPPSGRGHSYVQNIFRDAQADRAIDEAHKLRKLGHKVSSVNGLSWSNALDAHPLVSISQRMMMHHNEGSVNTTGPYGHDNHDQSTLENTRLNSFSSSMNINVDPSRPTQHSEGLTSTWTSATASSSGLHPEYSMNRNESITSTEPVIGSSSSTTGSTQVSSTTLTAEEEEATSRLRNLLKRNSTNKSVHFSTNTTDT